MKKKYFIFVVGAVFMASLIVASLSSYAREAVIDWEEDQSQIIDSDGGNNRSGKMSYNYERRIYQIKVSSSIGINTTINYQYISCCTRVKKAKKKPCYFDDDDALCRSRVDQESGELYTIF